MPMILILSFIANFAGATGEDKLALAKLIVPEGAQYRFVSGPEESCPGGDTIFWRKTPVGDYLQLTPNMGIFGFDKEGWFPLPDATSDKKCQFEVRTEVRKKSIMYLERERCPNFLREIERNVVRDGEFGLKVELLSRFTETGKAMVPTRSICLLQRMRAAKKSSAKKN